MSRNLHFQEILEEPLDRDVMVWWFWWLQDMQRIQSYYQRAQNHSIAHNTQRTDSLATAVLFQNVLQMFENRRQGGLSTVINLLYRPLAFYCHYGIWDHTQDASWNRQSFHFKDVLAL